jgi:DNA-binding XRE family transcriptional regulator
MIHRHLDLPPHTPVDEMPLAAIHDLLDRGDLDDWLPLLREIEREPHGELTAAVARLVDAYPMYGTSPLIRAWIERCRNRGAARTPDGAEAGTLADVRLSLGKTQAEVARAMGISQSDYSKLERRRDVRVSTLRSAAGALGGSLHLMIHLPDRTIDIALPSSTGPL